MLGLKLNTLLHLDFFLPYQLVLNSFMAAGDYSHHVVLKLRHGT